jgi:hypothetical protein
MSANSAASSARWYGRDKCRRHVRTVQWSCQTPRRNLQPCLTGKHCAGLGFSRRRLDHGPARRLRPLRGQPGRNHGTRRTARASYSYACQEVGRLGSRLRVSFGGESCVGLGLSLQSARRSELGRLRARQAWKHARFRELSYDWGIMPWIPPYNLRPPPRWRSRSRFAVSAAECPLAFDANNSFSSIQRLHQLSTK